MIIVRHLLKHAFICELAEEICFTQLNAQNNLSETPFIPFSIGDS